MGKTGAKAKDEVVPVSMSKVQSAIPVAPMIYSSWLCDCYKAWSAWHKNFSIGGVSKRKFCFMRNYMSRDIDFPGGGM